MSSSLERRYRLLLNAYPPEYLDTHESEILSTLLEGSRPGQLSPAFGDALSIVMDGLRARVRLSVGRSPAAVWVDAIRLAVLLSLASVLLDVVAGGSELMSMISTVLVAAAMVAVVTATRRAGIVLSVVATFAAVAALNQWQESLPPLKWIGDVAGLIVAVFVLSAISRQQRAATSWPWWLAAVAIAIPFLSRLFWLDGSEGVGFQIPLSVFELVLPIAILSGAAVLMHDPRPGIAAAIYAALHLVVPIAHLGQYPGSWTDLGAGPLTLALMMVATVAGVVGWRRLADDVVLPAT